MKFSASQAAIEVGKSVPTVTRAINNGKLTASGPKGGPYEIDASELFRVWPRVTPKGNETPPMLGSETPSVTSDLQHEVEILRERLKAAEGISAERAAQIEDLRTRLDAEGQERRKLTAILTSQVEQHASAPEKAEEQGRGVFGWFSRRKA
jgi:hypothetical protein